MTQASITPKADLCIEHTDITAKPSEQLIHSMYPEVSFVNFVFVVV